MVTVCADWERLGKAAGYRRNEDMANMPGVSAVLAMPGGRGTQHMIDIARRKALRVIDLSKVGVN